MNSSVWLIAWRYLCGARHEKSVSVMVKICFIGILIGSCSLALVMAVMGGFEQATHEKMQGIHAQALIRNNSDALNVNAISKVFKQEFPEVVGYSPQQIGQVILNTDHDQDMANVVMIKGIDPHLEAATSSIEQKIIQPTKANALSAIIRDQMILIGSGCAHNLHLHVGDSVNLIYVASDKAVSQKINLDSMPAIIGGIFKTGIEEFDTSLIFCSQSMFDTLFPGQGISQIALKFQQDTNEHALITRLKSRLKLEVYSWKDLYPALVSALKLEKYVMFFILALITLVASMNMISLLFMQIIQKRGDIAILQSMGMHHTDINSIFFIMAITISSVSSFLGLILAWFVGMILQRYPLFTLPDVYYVSTLPVHLDLRIFAFIFAVILVMSIVATWIPIRSIKNINIADVLRYDA